MIEQQLLNYAINNSFAIIVALILLFRTEKVIKENTKAIQNLAILIEKMNVRIAELER